jgi:hypothetical protein
MVPSERLELSRSYALVSETSVSTNSTKRAVCMWWMGKDSNLHGTSRPRGYSPVPYQLGVPSVDGDLQQFVWVKQELECRRPYEGSRYRSRQTEGAWAQRRSSCNGKASRAGMMVWTVGFEPTTSRFRNGISGLAELRPVKEGRGFAVVAFMIWQLCRICRRHASLFARSQKAKSPRERALGGGHQTAGG